jgi:hypothetical protein
MTTVLDDLPDELRELVAAEKGCPGPAPGVEARVFARVAGSVSLMDGPPVSPSEASTAPLAGGGVLARAAAHVTRKGLATFLVGAAVGATAVGTIDRVGKPASPPAVIAPTAPKPSEPAPPPIATELPPPPVETPAVPSVRRPAPAFSTDAKDKRLEAERKLIEMARSALARGQKDGALVALKRHQRSFPTGELVEERESLLVSALVATGDFAQARQQAARFHRLYPKSLFAPMVDQAVPQLPASSTPIP